AEQYLLRQRKADARKLADAVLAKQKDQALAAYVKARLLMAAGDEDQAKAILESAVDSKQPELKVLNALGKLYFEAKEFGKAAETFELARKVEPYESKWLIELARVYAQSGDKDKHIQVLKDLVPTDADDLDQRKRLTRLLLDAGNLADAEQY